MNKVFNLTSLTHNRDYLIQELMSKATGMSDYYSREKEFDICEKLRPYYDYNLIKNDSIDQLRYKISFLRRVDSKLKGKKVRRKAKIIKFKKRGVK